ncbi:hypothetical protein Halhy_2176 [Haliscomenobacter hydrossis DSM 1100]|uniref:Sulfatase-modifying factor enzyme-like domain-containing protein n=2 Tax=Haliscomenobacter TaxID=2349 RepID=F4KRV5_HALH1|nr:hypothetical protein Halhy_2176 [Haliscomenobacter hydrossis DSM 1100]
MKRIYILMSLLLGVLSYISASNLRISAVKIETEAATTFIQFTLAWENAWHNAKNHDAAWVFVKFKPQDPNYNARHCLLNLQGHQVREKMPATLLDPTISMSTDKIGIFVYPSKPYRGNVQWTLRLALDRNSIGLSERTPGEWKVSAMEMVYVPAGGYYLGDPDTTARQAAAFFSKTNPEANSLYEVKAEDQVIPIGEALGQLNYRPSESIYQGDRQGPIPAEFPKGVQAFYIQKYEITQGAYVTFLNDLGTQASFFRANFAGKGYAQSRGSISTEGDQYVAKSTQRPLNFVSWDDGCAFADWAGLRPMTELEFEKACRGPVIPLAHVFPWGTDNKKELARFVDLDDELKLKPGLSEAQLSDDKRAIFGASYWWVMDLAGSLWERVVSAGHPNGRAYRGSHGDGRLSGYGYATNADWPKGDDERGGGYGYRGGGYYEHGKPEGDFNPHSPVSWRNYAAWAGGPRSIAYGFRCVRTAP